MCAAINRSLDSGLPLVDPEFYANITAETLGKALLGDDDVPCPMIQQRVQCLHGMP